MFGTLQVQHGKYLPLLATSLELPQAQVLVAVAILEM